MPTTKYACSSDYDSTCRCAHGGARTQTRCGRFLQKPVQFSQLQSVLKTATQTTQSHYERYKIRHCYAQLSRKELDILALLIQGCINRQIAEALNISVRTVEVHRSHIMEKCKRKLLLN